MEGEVIALSDYRSEKPDAEHVCIIVKDGQPERWFRFTCSFLDGDAEFSFDLWARDWADAERRVSLLRATARVNGQVYTTVPA